ncbi:MULTISPECIES: glycosyltransferase [unclassified Empedobacter]|uniref:glycosyltransferase n=1 Tax=unclassified Empedobacter TaxID=2643773 RepID=UPI0025BD6085|nr:MULTISPECIES: glycosyltransferase [unclassified Empedobacter]
MNQKVKIMYSINNNNKKTIVISAVNLVEGGALTILIDCIEYLVKLSTRYNIFILVNNKSLFEDKYKTIKFIEFPKSKKYYFYRLYYEYIYFRKFSRQIKPYLWLSLHDISPNVNAVIKAVYCHNPSPFNDVSIEQLFSMPKYFFFGLFYKYLYKINIKKNNYVIVQQNWLKKEFVKSYNLKNEKVIVALPEYINKDFLDKNFDVTDQSDRFKFIYSSFPRPFKNFEVICNAVKYLNSNYDLNFEVILTISGLENKYSNELLKKYQNQKNIKFIGLQSKEKIFDLYNNCDVLIFPSKLETWGLPITEFKLFKKPIIVADLPYAKETIGKYDASVKFKVDDYIQLALIMKTFISKENVAYDITEDIVYNQPHSKSWKELFKILLNGNS